MAKKSLASMFSLNTLKKKFTFLTRPKNINKVLFLVGILIVLFMLHKFYLSKEGFESSPEELEDNVSSQKSLVLFYADWCGHCKEFMPIWDKTTKTINDANKGVKLIKVECGKPQENEGHKMLMDKYSIQGYPTIKFFENGQAKEYEGPRTEEGIVEFLGV